MLLSFAAMVTITFLYKKLSVGDSIVLMSGPFSNFIATIERTDKRGNLGHYWTFWGERQNLS